MSSPKDKDALRYYRVAKQRLGEAKDIQAAGLPAPAQYFGGFAVECILKALVVTITAVSKRPKQGQHTINWLKKEFGHDLWKLRQEAAKCGAQMPQAEARDSCSF